MRRTFSVLAISVVFFFLARPVRVPRECRRVLRPGAPVAIYTTGPELRGTPAAPEPLVSPGHLHCDAELAPLTSGPDRRLSRPAMTAAARCSPFQVKRHAPADHARRGG